MAIVILNLQATEHHPSSGETKIVSNTMDTDSTTRIPQTPYNTLNSPDLKRLLGDKEDGGGHASGAPIMQSLQSLFEVPAGSGNDANGVDTQNQNGMQLDAEDDSMKNDEKHSNDDDDMMKISKINQIAQTPHNTLNASDISSLVGNASGNGQDKLPSNDKLTTSLQALFETQNT